MSAESHGQPELDCLFRVTCEVEFDVDVLELLLGEVNAGLVDAVLLSAPPGNGCFGENMNRDSWETVAAKSPLVQQDR